MVASLHTFTCYYFRYVKVPSVEELIDLGIQSKEIKAKNFRDAEERWWRQNPAGDVYRQWFCIEDENGNEFSRNATGSE